MTTQDQTDAGITVTLSCKRCGGFVHRSWDHLDVGEHGERWTCPKQCQSCGSSLLDHDEGCQDANAHPGPESDRDETAHTLATAQAEIARLSSDLGHSESMVRLVVNEIDHQHSIVAARDAEIARYQALVVEWRAATREYTALDRKARAFETDDQRLRRLSALARMDAAEIALSKSVPEVAS